MLNLKALQKKSSGNTKSDCSSSSILKERSNSCLMNSIGWSTKFIKRQESGTLFLRKSMRLSKSLWRPRMLKSINFLLPRELTHKLSESLELLWKRLRILRVTLLEKSRHHLRRSEKLIPIWSKLMKVNSVSSVSQLKNSDSTRLFLLIFEIWYIIL